MIESHAFPVLEHKHETEEAAADALERFREGVKRLQEECGVRTLVMSATAEFGPDPVGSAPHMDLGVAVLSQDPETSKRLAGMLARFVLMQEEAAEKE